MRIAKPPTARAGELAQSAEEHSPLRVVLRVVEVEDGGVRRYLHNDIIITMILGVWNSP